MPRPPHRPGFRRLALLCAGLLSCTTVRTPVSTIAPAVDLRDGRAAPQLELWVESNRTLSPAEEERYRAEARSALEQALAGRAEPHGDAFLVVRAQGVTRTRGHRADQTAATAGLVVGAVVVVTAVVLAIVSGGKGKSAPSRPALPAARAPFPGRVGTVRAPPGFSPAARALRPSLPARHLPTVPAPGAEAWRRPHGRAGPAVGIDVDVGFWWILPLGPEPPPPAYAYDPAVVPEPVEPLPPELPSPPAGGEELEPSPPEPPTLTLAPPPRLPVEERGFFDGDRLVLEGTIIDRATGEELWTKRVSRKADPRDPRAVRQAVDELLAQPGWMPPPLPGAEPPPGW